MGKGRLEAFTDAIVPIIMTVLVLELQAPHNYSWLGLWEMREELLAYAISFFLLAIVWGNHHHMFQVVKKINGTVIWANTLLVFFLSFIPFATSIVNNDPNSLFGSQLYTLLFIGINLSWNFLRVSLLRADKTNRVMVDSLKREPKSIITLGAFVVVFLLSFLWHQFGMIGTFLVMMIWLMPYKRIEKAFHNL
ncbi:TMEM175 family protein [Lentilactobacillus farraginis]|uniref:Integral membrane protein n=1 Tax=Lentilactobacillus farraginis DSM 18382 = JCM 14108 TaxID=1423743 RepID=X0QEZ7_9LACO|nr:TMEM175 family protein [Lentilactobacillus farraginis]KRM10839.1 integral membrane protein [Lentilactobacillus farraginis DSM 18382 = JCM 14108]GAF37195.1 integral membrane protein [Lentilactobacillus farraginis DSM 18382 = JCM 14108]